MASKLEKMVALIKELAIGQTIRFNGRDAELSAFSDEHVFISIALSPEEFEGGKVEDKRDRRLKNLEAECYGMESEIERLLGDPRYYEYRREEERRRGRNRYMQELHWGRTRRAPDYDLRIPQEAPVPGPERWLDPLTFKTPTQQRRGG